MNRPFTSPEPDDAAPAECRPTLERLLRALDGGDPEAMLRDDAHLRGCRSCRERVHAASILTRALGASPRLDLNVSTILAAIAVDHATIVRRRWIAAGTAVAVAAGVLLAIFFWPSVPQPGQPLPLVRQRLPEAPPPVEPPRIDRAIANAGAAIQGIGRNFTEPGLPSPSVFAPLTEALSQSPLPPMAVDLEPAATSLAELPEAALSGIEPVTESASRVFTRLLQDVPMMPSSASPKMKS